MRKSTFTLCCLLLFFIAPAQVTRLSNNSNLEYGLALGNIGVLVSDVDSLWRTDGTAGGTFKYATNVSVDLQSSVALFNNKIYFSGITAANGKELWVTDGTAGGTSMVKDINTGTANASPTAFIVYNSTLFFVATTATNGAELWKSDGTGTGTVLVKDINPGTVSGIPTDPSFFVNNNILYLMANDGTAGAELWKTDGTTAGTILLKDINPGAASSSPANLTALGTLVLFSADAASTGVELYKTDGTTTGTMLVKDINNAFAGLGSNPSQLMLFNNKVYFGAFDLTSGFELWSTDGSTAGTSLVKDIDPGSVSSFPLLFNAAFINNKFYFSASTTAEGNELWMSDGTAAGTQLVKDINVGTDASDPFIMLDFFGAGSLVAAHNKLFNGKIFFQASTPATGLELYITDGTAAGTTMVKDIRPGVDSSLDFDFNYYYYPAGLYLAANDGSTGMELWKSNGTSGGTTRVADINPTGNSLPRFLMVLNDHLIFTANDGDNATNRRDLFQVDGALLMPVTLMNFNAAVAGKNVLLTWTTSTEINSSHFEIERSEDGTTFSKVGQVQGAGNSTVRISYDFIDQEAFRSGSRQLYYRLRKVDKDGKAVLSSIVMVALKGKHLLEIYPNPVKDILHLQFNSGQPNGVVRIVDGAGKVINTISLLEIQSNNNRINVTGLRRGTYYVQFTSDSYTETLKMIKH